MKLQVYKLIAMALCAVMALGTLSGCADSGETVKAADLDAQRAQFTQMADSRVVEEAAGVTAQSIREMQGDVLVAVDYPAVDANQQITAEIASYISKLVGDFHTEAAGMGQPDESTGLFTMNVTYKPFVVGNGLVGFKFTESSYTGKTDKSGFIQTFVYDMATGNKIALDDVFNKTTSYLNVLADTVRAYLQRTENIKNNMDEELFKEGTAPVIQNYSNFVVTPDAKIIFYFNKNTIAPAEAGTIEVIVPLVELDAVLNEQNKEMLYGGNVRLPEAAQAADGATDDGAGPAYSAAADIPMLQKEGDYMQAFGLGGIDPYNDKVVALTFDDGPSPHTPALLDTLQANNAVATFFVVGEMADIRRETLKRIYDEGHELATHSWDHPDLMTLSIEQVRDGQYGRTNDVIEEVTGLRTLFDRPPGGSMSAERAAELDRAQVLWSVDTLDWKYKSDSGGVDIIYNAIMDGAVDGSVILLHDLHENSVKAAVRAIPELAAQGYMLVSVSQMMQIAQLRGYDVPYRFGTEVYAPQGDAGPEDDAGREAT